ncbi:hypothetical protein LTS18_000291, partial [Coniosporium uncinatum]
MASTPTVPSQYANRGYGDAPDVMDYAQGNPNEASPLAQSYQQSRGMDASSIQESEGGGLQRSISRGSTHAANPSRSNTLKKKGSVKRGASVKRSASRKSLRPGSIKGTGVQDGVGDDFNNVFSTPIPTSGTPTDVLANRFQDWRKFLKELIAYFREVQSSYEHRSKAILKVSNTIANTNTPNLFMTEGGINDANVILRNYHKNAASEANKAKEIESDVIDQLSGLRADLAQKIKEIKSLSGDFKNSVDKEKEGT